MAVTKIQLNQIDDGGASTNHVLKWNGSVWAPSATADGNGIYTGSGNIPDNTVATLASGGNFQFNYSDATSLMYFIDGTGVQIAYPDSTNAIYVNSSELDLEDASGNSSIKLDAIAVKIEGAVSLMSEGTASQITSNQNNYAPFDPDAYSSWRIESDAARDITGIAGGFAGRILILHNFGSNTITLKDSSGSSTAANRFDLVADLALVAGMSATLHYDDTSDRWRCIGIGYSSGGGGISDGDKGDITVSSSGTVWTIDNDVVTFAKMQNITSDRLLGRDTASSGDVEEITVGGGIEFTGSTGIQRSALTGDVTASAGSNSTTIANNAVTYGKMQDVTATNRFIGRITAGSGDPEELTGTQATTLLDVFTSSLKGLAPSSGGGTTNFLRADGNWAAPSATVTGGGLTWSVVTVNANLAVDTGTIANKGTLLTMTLPTTSAVGSIIQLVGINAGLWRIAQNSGQTIYFGNKVTTTGASGYLESTLARDSVELVCVVANTDWNVISSVGSITYV